MRFLKYLRWLMVLLSIACTETEASSRSRRMKRKVAILATAAAMFSCHGPSYVAPISPSYVAPISPSAFNDIKETVDVANGVLKFVGNMRNLGSSGGGASHTRNANIIGSGFAQSLQVMAAAAAIECADRAEGAAQIWSQKCELYKNDVELFMRSTDLTDFLAIADSDGNLSLADVYGLDRRMNELIARGQNQIHGMESDIAWRPWQLGAIFFGGMSASMYATGFVSGLVGTGIAVLGGVGGTYYSLNQSGDADDALAVALLKCRKALEKLRKLNIFVDKKASELRVITESSVLSRT